MGVRFYDEALYNKIQSWVKDPNMRILKPEETKRLFQLREDLTNDEPIKLPIIAISRKPSFEVLNTNKRPLSFNGKLVKSSKAGGIKLNAIAISLQYQIDIYTKEYEVADEYLRNFIFNFVNFPKLNVNIPYNDVKLTHNAYCRLLTDVDDNSDIPEKLFADQFTRWTLTITIDDAYLFSASFGTNIELETAGLQVQSRVYNEDTKVYEVQIDEQSEISFGK